MWHEYTAATAKGQILRKGIHGTGGADFSPVFIFSNVFDVVFYVIINIYNLQMIFDIEARD